MGTESILLTKNRSQNDFWGKIGAASTKNSTFFEKGDLRSRPFDFAWGPQEPQMGPRMGTKSGPELEPKRGPKRGPKRWPKWVPKWGPKWGPRWDPKWIPEMATK